MATMKKIASMPLNYADLGDTALSLLGRETYDHLIASRLPEGLSWCGDEILGPADWTEELDLAGIIDAAATEMLERYTEDRYWEDGMTDAASDIISNGNYDAAVALMDDEIRESVHADLAPCTELEFLAEYLRRHLSRYGEEFTV